MKYGLWILCLALFAIIMFMVMCPDKTAGKFRQEYARAIAERDSFKVREAIGLRMIDSSESAGKQKDTVIAALKTEQAIARKALDKTTTTANRLAVEVKVLSKVDTTEFGRKCDSLAEQVQNFAYLYNEYKDYSDSLTVNMHSQTDDYIRALEEQKRLYTDLKLQYDGLMKAYTSLFDTTTDLMKDLKRQKLKTKIVALLALVAGAAAVLK